jgi:hypothetical protein
MRQGASHSANTVEFFMRAASFGFDVSFGQRSDPIICIKIKCFSVHAQKPFDGWQTGLILKPLPSIGTAF